MKNIVGIIILGILLMGCVSGPPYLTEEQEKKSNDIQVYRVGSTQEKQFIVVGKVEAADCTGPAKSRLYGKEEFSIDYLRKKAVALGADAIIDVECRNAPLINNCWAAKLCVGKAIKWK